MRLLLLDHYAGGPSYGMEFRPWLLAREWVRAGHAVQVVGASFSHLRRVQPRPGHEEIDGIAFRWIRAPRYRGNGIGRVVNIACFLLRVALQARTWARGFRPDAVIASSTYPMDIWVARRIARLAGAKLVHEIHDLWPASPMEIGGMSARHPFIRLCQRAEDDACRDADVVISMLPRVAEHLAAHGLDLRKLHVVPNGIAPEDWADAPAPLEPAIAGRIAEARTAGRLVVVYAGAHGAPNALDPLLDAAALLRTEPFSFVLVGDGHEKARLARRVADEGLEEVALFPPIAKAAVPALLAQADIAWLGWRRHALYRFGIAPNKLMDYMMAGCAVLHSVEAGNDPVAESGCGLTVAAENPTALAEGLRRLAAAGAHERRAMGARGRAYVLERHAYPMLARRFIEAIE